MSKERSESGKDKYKSNNNFVEYVLVRRGFVKTFEEKIEAIILLFNGVSKAEVFRRMSEGKGIEKSHCSNKKEGELKDS